MFIRTTTRALIAAASAAVALLLAVPGMAQASLQPGCTQSGQVVTCQYSSPTDTGTTAQFTVPAGVSRVHVALVGGTGGGATDPRCDPWCGGAGTLETGDLAVYPSEVIVANVGGNANGSKGGVGGGGDGCWGGGGDSSIYIPFVPFPWKMIAGGGGGDGCAGTGSSGTNDLETQGGGEGESGRAGVNSFDDGAGGQYLGAGGAASGGGGTAGTTGGFGAGGVGGAGVTTGSAVGGRGGGGGGGSTGGGGGGGGSSAASGLSFYAGSGGGGAGGVSSASAANVTFGSDYSEAPRAVISYNVINFTSSPPPTGAVGQRYSYAYATAGDAAVAFKVTAGSLPPGLALSSTGVISGTPTAAGSYTYFVTATGATATQTRFDSITIAAPATTTTPGGNPKTILHTPPPAACVSSAAGLNVSLATTRLAGARVRDAEFFVDNGVARHLKRRVTTHGKPRVVRTTVYLPNATARHLPVSLNIPTSGLASGAHTLTVKLTLISTVKTRHGPKTMATVQTQRTTFAIC